MHHHPFKGRHFVIDQVGQSRIFDILRHSIDKRVHYKMFFHEYHLLCKCFVYESASYSETEDIKK